MPIIKRYANRKLYNTKTKQYITLEGIADLIRRGEDVQVVDNTSGEDLTAVTLSQIIFEQEKKQSGFLPKSVLTGLVQAGGDTLNGLRKTLAAPLDMLHHVEEEIDQRIQQLIKKGEISREEALRFRDKLLEEGRKRQAQVSLKMSADGVDEEKLGALLEKRGIPSRQDLDQIRRQIELLTEKLNSLDPDGAPKDSDMPDPDQA